MAEMMRKPKNNSKEKQKREKNTPDRIDKTQETQLKEKYQEINKEKQIKEERERKKEKLQGKKHEENEDITENKEDMMKDGDEATNSLEKIKLEPFPISSTSFTPFPTEIEPTSEKNIEKKLKDMEIGEDEKIEDFENGEEAEEETELVKQIQEKYTNLTELERNVLEIAEEILKLKRYDASLEAERVEKMSPMVEELYNKCIAKLTHTRGFSKKQIFESIQELEKKFWLVTEQRRTKKEIIESEIHGKILDFIGKYPGVHARDPAIEEELEITRNPFLKHIMTLEAFGLIRTVKVGRTMNYFLANVPDIFDDLCVLFKNPLIPEIIRSFLKNPNENISKIADDLDVYHGAIQYHLKKLIQMEILRKEKKDGNNYYYPNKELLKRYNRIFDEPPFDI